jgi:acyl-coenzyme A synthetase/AMP-(fatty) acid ligase
VLRAHGVKRGDRVAILLPQMPEVAAAHVAIYKLAAWRSDAHSVRAGCDFLSRAEFRRGRAYHQ